MLMTTSDKYECKQKNAMKSIRLGLATWYNTIDNGYDPDNTIKLTGELTADGNFYEVFQIWGLLFFNEGIFIV